jgi:hypothetical protein
MTTPSPSRYIIHDGKPPSLSEATSARKEMLDALAKNVPLVADYYIGKTTRTGSVYIGVEGAVLRSFDMQASLINI